MSAQQRRDDFQRLCLAQEDHVRPSPAARRRQGAVQRHRRVVATWLTALLVSGIVLPPMMAGTTSPHDPATSVTVQG